MFCCEAATVLHIWGYIYEQWDGGGRHWKTSWNHGMIWLVDDVWAEAQATQIDASLRWFTEQTQTLNGKASIYLSLWNGQHGLLMKLAIKELSDSCTHTLLPSKASSFSSKWRKREKYVSVIWESADVTFSLSSHWKTSNLLSKAHKIKRAVNEHQQTQSWLNRGLNERFSRWVMLIVTQSDPGLSEVF